MNPWIIGGAGVVALLLLGGQGTREPASYSYGGVQLKPGIDRDPRNLDPAFASKLELVFQRMRARGFDPILWEGFRTEARAQELKKAGVGIYPSLHQYGLAADIVDRRLRWNAPRAFYDAIGYEADRLGLTWGGHWPKGDKPHVQGVTVADQRAVFARPAIQRAA